MKKEGILFDLDGTLWEVIDSTFKSANEIVKKYEDEEKTKKVVLWVLAIVGAVVAVAGIAYVVYRFLSPDDLDDFEDDLEDDDDFDDDFFDEEEDIFEDNEKETKAKED